MNIKIDEWMIRSEKNGDMLITLKQAKMLSLAGKWQRNDSQCTPEQKKAYASGFAKLKAEIYDAYTKAFNEAFLGFDKISEWPRNHEYDHEAKQWIENMTVDQEKELQQLRKDVERIKFDLYEQLFHSDLNVYIKVFYKMYEQVKNRILSSSAAPIMQQLIPYTEKLVADGGTEEYFLSLLNLADKLMKGNSYLEVPSCVFVCSIEDYSKDLFPMSEPETPMKATA